MDVSQMNLEQTINAKLSILKELEQQGELQKQLVSQGSGTQLLQLLAGKQPIIDRLSTIEHRLGGLQAKRSNASDSAGENTPEKSRCKQLAQQCNIVGQRVLELEQECEVEAKRWRDSLANSMQEFSQFASSSAAKDDSFDETHLAQFDESS